MLASKKSAGLVTFLGLCLVASIWVLIASSVVYASVYWYFRPSYVVETPLCLIPGKYPPLGATLSLPKACLSHEDYSITLELVLPRSPENQNIRTFVALLQFDNPVESILGRGKENSSNLFYRAPAMLPFKSYIIDTLDQVVFSPLYVFGFKDQTELIPITLVDWVENPNDRFNRVQVSIDHPIQVASAKLVWSTQLNGVRKFMYYHPFMSCFVFVGTLWFVGMVTTVTVCLLVWVRTSLVSEPSKPETKPHKEKQSTTEKAMKRSSSASLHFEWNGAVPSAYSTARFSPTKPRSRHTSNKVSRSRVALYQPIKSEYEDSIQETEDWQEETLPTINSDFEIKKED